MTFSHQNTTQLKMYGRFWRGVAVVPTTIIKTSFECISFVRMVFIAPVHWKIHVDYAEMHIIAAPATYGGHSNICLWHFFFI